jgi:hypothetical protein
MARFIEKGPQQMARRARSDDSKRLLRGQLHDCSCHQGEAREVAGLNEWAVNVHHDNPGLWFSQNRLPSTYRQRGVLCCLAMAQVADSH